MAQCGALHLHAVPSLQCSVDQLLQGGEDSEDSLHRQHPGLALAQLDMDTRTAAPEHTELVAGLRGLHMAAGDILRVVAASAQLLSALVKMPCHFLQSRPCMLGPICICVFIPDQFALAPDSVTRKKPGSAPCPD